ncbi:FtsX-like permease family protein [Ornithinicoccus hortensis]|uniref:FtsX-like permease family protein n=1 Tax=Ornithinicoccus hortensis TaxID=82346 RepID=A0A542YQJ1_9MICO|nr:FtsX-like permease family protein [Ornithinicoccus hortensis]TQL50321.1 FtsX-like permease family protein [Ornithinicoccus hortensis]
MRPAARLTLLLLRRGGDTDRGALLLPVAAFGVVTALMLTVLGGARFFFTIRGPMAETYQSLAALAVILLVIPLLTLCGSAARLSARRRDEHLSTLRLLGAPTSTVTSMTVLESTLLAAAGTLAGVLGHLLLAPLVGLVSFHDSRLGAGNVLLGVPGTVLCVVALVVMAAVSSLVGLRTVVVSPLGVRTRQDAPRMSLVRVVAILLAVGLGLVAGDQLGDAQDIVGLVIGLVATFGVTMAVLNTLGPWVLRTIARRQARTASGPKSAERLLAARTVLDSPKAAWRQVSGVSLTSFVAVFAGVGLALSNGMAGTGPMAREDAIMLVDLRTGILLTLVISFVTVAASVAVNQSADILDRRDLYVSLDRMGMPRSRVDTARRRAVLSPLRVVSLGSALVAALLIAPLSGIALLTDPLSGLVIAAALAAGIGIVWLSLLATAPLLTRVTGSTVRTAD